MNGPLLDQIGRRIVREYPNSLFAARYRVNVAFHKLIKEIRKVFTKGATK